MYNEISRIWNSKYHPNTTYCVFPLTSETGIAFRHTQRSFLLHHLLNFYSFNPVSIFRWVCPLPLRPLSTTGGTMNLMKKTTRLQNWFSVPAVYSITRYKSAAQHTAFFCLLVDKSLSVFVSLLHWRATGLPRYSILRDLSLLKELCY